VMGTEKKKTKKKTSRAELGEYHLRLPADLNEWVRNYARPGGFQNELELVRHALRELKRQAETTA
jgi:Arc/MetJ-type ribon-helix-helix transcriptional regulator